MKTNRAATPISDPWEGTTNHFADQVHEADRPNHSQLLGPDGNPLPYAPRPPMGFDLRAKSGCKHG